MKSLETLFVCLKLKKRHDNFKKLDVNKVIYIPKIGLKKEIANENIFNSSYYGDPYAYDWYNSKFKDLNWKRRWIG